MILEYWKKQQANRKLLISYIWRIQQEVAKIRKEIASLEEKIAKSASTVSTPIIKHTKAEKRNARKIMASYYYQKVVDSEIIDVVLTTRRKRIGVNIYFKNDLQKDGKTKEVVRIYQPISLKGDSYLSIVNWSAGTRKSWHYNAKKRRLFRVASYRRRDRFLNTEFTYEDWLTEDINNYKYSFLKTEIINGRNTYKILSIPATQEEREKSQYSQKIYWIDAEFSHPVRIDFYDKEKTLAKTFIVEKIVKIAENFWRPKSAYIKNIKTNRTTKIYLKSWKINVPISAEKFSPRSLSVE